MSGDFDSCLCYVLTLIGCRARKNQRSYAEQKNPSVPEEVEGVPPCCVLHRGELILEKYDPAAAVIMVI